MHDAARLADGEGRARVDAEEDVLHGQRAGPVRVGSSPTRAWMTASRVPIGSARGRLDHATVERDQPPAAAGHHAVARVGGAGIDAEDDHAAGFSAPGPDAFRGLS